MRITEGPNLPRPVGLQSAQAPKPPTPPDKHLQQIDTLKRRSTVINLLDPIGMTLGLACTPVETLGSLQLIGTSLLHGNTGAAQTVIEGLVHRAVNPVAPFSYLYRGGQLAGAAIDGTVGGLEIAQGLRTNNNPMVAMGVADLIGGTSSAAALKTGLVVTCPQNFTQIQRMKTVFDAGFAVSTSMLRAGVAVVPALCIQSALGLTELAYMNHDGFRQKTDNAVYWLTSKL